MTYKVLTIAYFEKQAKRLIKKYPSLKLELQQIIQKLETNPDLGRALGNDCYKIRISIASKNTGKSGGARLITYVRFVNETIYLLSIYDKSDEENIDDKKIAELKKQTEN